MAAAPLSPLLAVPNVQYTNIDAHPSNSQCTNFILFDVAIYMNSKGLTGGWRVMPVLNVSTPTVGCDSHRTSFRLWRKATNWTYGVCCIYDAYATCYYPLYLFIKHMELYNIVCMHVITFFMKQWLMINRYLPVFCLGWFVCQQDSSQSYEFHWNFLNQSALGEETVATRKTVISGYSNIDTRLCNGSLPDRLLFRVTVVDWSHFFTGVEVHADNVIVCQ